MNSLCPKRLRTETNDRNSKIATIDVVFQGVQTTTSILNLCSDIWQLIFQYFETIELFTTLVHITIAADQVLFNENERFYLRGLKLDEHLEDLPVKISLDRVISLTLHDSCRLDIIEQCPKLRSLKLFGAVEWMRSHIKKVIQQNIKIEQLTLAIPGIMSLPELLLQILSNFSLRRLEIRADDLKDSCKVWDRNILSSSIQQFILRSSCTFECNDLLYFLSHLTNIQLLDISLITKNKKPVPSFNFPNLRTLFLGLLEVSFDWITELVESIPSLVKLKLTGLVDEEGFVVNDRWMELFKSANILARIYVHLSMEQNDKSHYCEKLQNRLHALNLQLRSDNDDDNDCCQYYGSAHRWWSLNGIIIRPLNYL